MKRAIVVWIVEDDVLFAAQAWNEVSLVSAEFPGEVKKYWAADTSWNNGPALRSNVDQTLAIETHSGSPGLLYPDLPYPDLLYPDLVILDLMFGTENADEFLGGGFLANLRVWEASKKSKASKASMASMASKAGKPAFVILWSIHQGALATEEFVRDKVPSDPRVIETGSKRPELLKLKLRQLWRRIIEEREDMIE